MIESLILEQRDLISGELSQRWRVVDSLLDLRIAASSEALIDKVDRYLYEVPGVTTVRNSWWMEVLNDIELTYLTTVEGNFATS